ncbi:MAG: UDP-N-acetylmuramoyl-tripeptide--D-alanyl-D-alanine ligase [Clostridiaceae bacterium]|nr:UDP-N-acetylmuramoyl-tripeptide--D-alanyl-D-alanine ligase [Clostridiaceae bacterium]
MKYILLNVFLIILYTYYIQKMKHGFHILQLESYRNERYKGWINKNKNQILKTRELLLFLPIILIIVNEIVALVMAIIIGILLYISRQIYKEKKPLVVTKRIKRMFITATLIFVILSILVNIFVGVTIINNIVTKCGLLLVLLSINLTTIFTIYVVMIVNKINLPIENGINKKFYNSAKEKLNQMPNLQVIGITGSYGKTSTKYILKTILEQKYNVLMTPESFNTTMGVVRTINEKLNSMHQIFVCEMGAKNIGDIKEICDLVNPKYGVLTAIGPQHLETFKTIENVRKTKMELVDAINNKAFVNYEDTNIKETKIEKQNVKYGMSEECDVYAYNMKITEDGAVFDVHTTDEEITEIKTKLLGEHNIVNIVAAISVAKELGLSKEQIKTGIRFLKPIPHRLELKRNPNGLTIIDDAYNSNIQGAQKALETLKLFNEKNRILVTPGIVDLGEYAEEYNTKLGEKAAECSDFVILVGEKQAKPIYTGLKNKNYPENKIFIAKDLQEAIKKWGEFPIKETVILLENDLPDNYL